MRAISPPCAHFFGKGRKRGKFPLATSFFLWYKLMLNRCFERENSEFVPLREDRSAAGSRSAGCRLVRPRAAARKCAAGRPPLRAKSARLRARIRVVPRKKSFVPNVGRGDYFFAPAADQRPLQIFT